MSGTRIAQDACYPPTVGESMGEAWWCLKGFVYHVTIPLRVVPLCRLGWHRWCAECSPVVCVRCGVKGHD